MYKKARKRFIHILQRPLQGFQRTDVPLLSKRPGFSSMLLYTKLTEAHLKCSSSFIQKYILDHNFKLLQKVRKELSTLDIQGWQKISILLLQKSYWNRDWPGSNPCAQVWPIGRCFFFQTQTLASYIIAAPWPKSMFSALFKRSIS